MKIAVKKIENHAEYVARAEKISLAQQTQLIYSIWKRNFLQFKRTWMISLLWIIIEPLFILTAIGYGLGSFVPTIAGVSYVDFFYPALICSTSMFVSYFVSTYDNFSKLTHQQLFATQILTRIEPQEIVIGEVIWAATKGTISAAGVSVVAALLGLVDSWRIFPALFVVFLSCLVFSCFGMLITTWVKNYDQIIYPSSGLIVPMSLFSGTYFPVDHMPYGLKYASYLFPLTHSVRMVRALLNEGFDWWMLLNTSYLLLLIYFLVRICSNRLAQKILN